MKFFICFVSACFIISFNATGQKALKTDSLKIFADDKPINVTLITDLRQLINKKLDGKYQNALFSCKLPDSSEVSEQILLRTRGHFRLNNCHMPSLRLNFRSPSSPKLSFLKELKLVNTCGNRPDYEQILIREYLVYKIFNLLTDMSFRVRLLRINYQDIQERRKPFLQYAILLENIDAMAARNNCKELDVKNVHPEYVNRDQMTMVAVFQYMIGNTDWSVSANHNIRLILPRKDSLAIPYAVPYDFDFGGLVNADYASAPENLPIANVRERLYRGWPRTNGELQAVFDIYNQKKAEIYRLIQNCDLLQPKHKKDMIDYLEDFYKTINNKREVQRVFFENVIRS
ncbi:MAG: hypothetical protein ABR503_04440 [Chitinophagaceae bacterium]